VRFEEMSDEELLLSARDGTDADIRRAVSIIFERHKSHIYTLFLRMAVDAATAEDLLQETFLRLLRHARRYRPIAKVTTWLYRIAFNLALNEARRRSVRVHLSLNPETNPDTLRVIDTVASEEADPFERLSDRECERLVREVLEMLPPQQRAVLILCDMEGLSYEEAGKVLGLRPGTVGSRLCRARRTFAFLFLRAIKGE